MENSFAKINKMLDSGSKEEKIKILESLSSTTDSKIINKIISMLDDPEIEVRGEAFSWIWQSNCDELTRMKFWHLTIFGNQSKNSKIFFN